MNIQGFSTARIKDEKPKRFWSAIAGKVAIEELDDRYLSVIRSCRIRVQANRQNGDWSLRWNWMVTDDGWKYGTLDDLRQELEEVYRDEDEQGRFYDGAENS